MLHVKDLDLDAVIELKVDEGILLDRIGVGLTRRWRGATQCARTTIPIR